MCEANTISSQLNMHIYSPHSKYVTRSKVIRRLCIFANKTRFSMTFFTRGDWEEDFCQLLIELARKRNQIQVSTMTNHNRFTLSCVLTTFFLLTFFVVKHSSKLHVESLPKTRNRNVNIRICTRCTPLVNYRNYSSLLSPISLL